MSLTYTNYLKIDELLELQQLKSDPPEHDETLFIIIHQTYELWFKQILHEFGKLRKELEDGNTWSSLKTMRRVLTILKTMVAQIDILETMTPLEFNSFRKFLGQSSGFQSLQFREMEIVCGLRFPLMKEAHKDQPEHLEILEKRMNESTLWESFCAYLRTRGFEVHPQRENEKGLVHNPSEKIQQELVKAMNEDPEAALIAELFVDYDEGLQEWRYRHVKMVERTIGTKKGTGGSDGAKYLRKTLNHPIFPDLWAIRSKF
ncbi:tryptophan 2,3-dioxygenase [Gracilimonas mengyeensis]|uniref:Tryptophan 2,3-dioxygenase n=1 Tax=Gracilimonas mengyeensis TaxID=1302730 RepID=A0A521EBK3_9BACT|nr:tryptophan 2,3-dioxygenase family protein [Gracilimonas mengyeensis]SMO80540.1 tryptophan 2,3-dioxygenase [Gracilimonas mengyeensis]